MKPRLALTLGAVLVLLSSCYPYAYRWYTWGQASDLLSRAQPQSKATITGHSYDEIWMAAYTVANEHFEIREQDKTRGVIKAKRLSRWMDSAAAVGIWISPSAPGAEQYVVEVINVIQEPLEFYQHWEKKVLRDLDRVLAGEPIR